MSLTTFSEADAVTLARVRAGDRQAEAAAVRRWERYAGWFVAQTLAREPYLDRDDLTQEAHLALLRAIRGWRPEAGAGFVTYAYHCIKNAIGREAIRQHNRGGFALAPRQSVVQVRSLDEPRGRGDEVDPSGVLQDELAAPDVLERVALHRWACQVLAGHPRHLQVVTAIFGLDGAPPVASNELAKRLGLTKQNVAYLQAQAIRKLRIAWVRHE